MPQRIVATGINENTYKKLKWAMEYTDEKSVYRFLQKALDERVTRLRAEWELKNKPPAAPVAAIDPGELRNQEWRESYKNFYEAGGKKKSESPPTPPAPLLVRTDISSTAEPSPFPEP